MPEAALRDPEITPEVWREMGLSDDEYRQVEGILGRPPTYTELGMFAVMWSEHCGYKYSRPVLRLFKRYREQLDSGALENAGVVDIGDGYGIAMKVESHNHPSAVEPFQGAATGVGGILRDIFTMGARPIASLNSLRFGELSDPHVRYLFEHVVAGIGFYGNCVGVPTIGGEVFFDPCYAGNPLVNAMALGLVRLDRIASACARGVGNSVLIVGSRTGRDGIHGATFASVELGPDSESKRPNVQMGDPFTEKLLIEATLEALETGAIVGIQDMGAAGITCSTCETAAKAGTGMEIDVALVPQREEGMTPYEIMLSESQERMLAIVQKGREEEVASIFRRWGLNAVVIGHVTDDGLVRVRQNGRVVAEVPAKALADECPTYQLDASEPDYVVRLRSRPVQSLRVDDHSSTLLKLLSRPCIASKRWVWEQYDHMVQTNTVVFPGSDAGVLRIRGVKTGIAVTTDCNSRIVYLDPYTGSRMAVYEAARNLVCSGAKPVAVTDCLNFGNPEKPEAFWQFKESVRGLADACEELSTPVVSGNVSFYNETPESAIYPTPVVGMLGVLDDVTNHVTSAFKREGDRIILLAAGWPEDPWPSLSGSELQVMLDGEPYGPLPGLDAARQKALFAAVLEMAAGRMLSSAHDVSEGGLAVCLAESCIAGGLGADVELRLPGPVVPSLYGEPAGVILVSTPPERASDVIRTAEAHGVMAVEMGGVGGPDIIVRGEGAELLRVAVAQASEAWESAIPAAMDTM
jgi:phosphoribosylformylglycinamidine synthase